MVQDDYVLKVSSSDSKVVKPNNAILSKGENAVIITGNTGTMASEGNLEVYVTDNDGVKTISTTPNGPLEDELELKIESILPMILAGDASPLLTYLTEVGEETEEEEAVSENEEEEEVDARLGSTFFVEDGILLFSANEFIDIEPITVKQNEDYVLSSEVFEKIGTTELNAQIGSYTGSVSLTSHTTDPTQTHMSYIDNMLVNGNNLITIQLLDSVGNPVYAKKDTILNLVSNDENVLTVPETVVVKEGEYFNTMKATTYSEGMVEIAILSQDLPLSKYEINVVDISPNLSLEMLGTKNWNERVEAKLSVTIPQIETSLSGFDVKWDTTGGEVRSSESVTNNEGTATLNIIANQDKEVTVSATVSGNGLSQSTVSETVQILNIPIPEETVEGVDAVPVQEETGSLPLDPLTMIMIIIPVAVGETIFFLKKTDRLEMITENLPIGDKIEEIKERISDIRNR